MGKMVTFQNCGNLKLQYTADFLKVFKIFFSTRSTLTCYLKLNKSIGCVVNFSKIPESDSIFKNGCVIQYNKKYFHTSLTCFMKYQSKCFVSELLVFQSNGTFFGMEEVLIGNFKKSYVFRFIYLEYNNQFTMVMG